MNNTAFSQKREQSPIPREARSPDTLFNSLQYGLSQIAADFRAQTITAFKNLDSANGMSCRQIARVVGLRVNRQRPLEKTRV